MAEKYDVLKMQEEAKRRVMEMQSRSRFLAQDRPPPSGEPFPPRPAPEPRAQEARPLLSKPENPDLSFLSALDTDKLLVLSLCLLLRREDADPFLLMALLYIVG